MYQGGSPPLMCYQSRSLGGMVGATVVGRTIRVAKHAPAQVSAREASPGHTTVMKANTYTKTASNLDPSYRPVTH